MNRRDFNSLMLAGLVAPTFERRRWHVRRRDLRVNGDRVNVHLTALSGFRHRDGRIGIVEGIVGIKQWEVTVTGFQNHGGTTAMNNRHDALLSAARFVEMVNRVVMSVPGRQVGTVGRIQAFPGAPNVIPGKVICSLELRDLDEKKIDTLYTRIREEAVKIGNQNGTLSRSASCTSTSRRSATRRCDRSLPAPRRVSVCHRA